MRQWPSRSEISSWIEPGGLLDRYDALERICDRLRKRSAKLDRLRRWVHSWKLLRLTNWRTASNERVMVLLSEIEVALRGEAPRRIR